MSVGWIEQGEITQVQLQTAPRYKNLRVGRRRGLRNSNYVEIQRLTRRAAWRTRNVRNLSSGEPRFLRSVQFLRTSAILTISARDAYARSRVATFPRQLVINNTRKRVLALGAGE